MVKDNMETLRMGGEKEALLQMVEKTPFNQLLQTLIKEGRNDPNNVQRYMPDIIKTFIDRRSENFRLSPSTDLDRMEKTSQVELLCNYIVTQLGKMPAADLLDIYQDITSPGVLNRYGMQSNNECYPPDSFPHFAIIAAIKALCVSKEINPEELSMLSNDKITITTILSRHSEESKPNLSTIAKRLRGALFK